MNICELHHELKRAQGNIIKEDRVKAYTALTRYHPNVATLAKAGWNSQDITQVLNVPLAFVQGQLARMDRHNAARRRFMMTGNMPHFEVPGMPTVFTIYQR